MLRRDARYIISKAIIRMLYLLSCDSRRQLQCGNYTQRKEIYDNTYKAQR